MESTTDLTGPLRRARWGYELTRLRRALMGFSPVYLLVGLACALGERPFWVLGVGVILFGVGVGALWYGRDIARAVLPGLVAGLVPFALVLGARYWGHVCHGTDCASLCLWACAVGGLLAGIVMGRIAGRRRAGLGFWAIASLVALLAAAMACVRLGGAGALGLALGYVAGALPGFIGSRKAPTRPNGA